MVALLILHDSLPCLAAKWPFVEITGPQACTEWSELVDTAVAEFPRTAGVVGSETAHRVEHTVW